MNRWKCRWQFRSLCVFDTAVVSLSKVLSYIRSMWWTSQLMSRTQTPLPCKGRIHTAELRLCLHFCQVCLVLQSFFRQLQHRDQVSHMESDSVTVKKKDIQTLVLFQHRKHPEKESIFTPTLLTSVICFPGTEGIMYAHLHSHSPPTVLFN